MARFGSVLTAMVTPFDDQGRLDLDGAVVLARHLIDNGSQGLVLAGTTGEGPVLADSEKADLWRAVSEAVTVPVVAGTGTNDTAHSVALSRLAAECGVDGLLVVTPYYNRPSLSGLSAHFRAVAAATELPILLYDIPIRSGRRIGTELLVTLSREVPTIVGVKDSTGDVPAAAQVVAETHDGFEVYSGDDALTLPFLSVGGVGIISVAAHWAGTRFNQMVTAFQSGQIDVARDCNAQLLSSFAFESTNEFPNPLPAKAMCRALGWPAGQCRLPMGEAPASLDVEARQLVEELTRTETVHQLA